MSYFIETICRYNIYSNKETFSLMFSLLLHSSSETIVNELYFSKNNYYKNNFKLRENVSNGSVSMSLILSILYYTRFWYFEELNLSTLLVSMKEWLQIHLDTYVSNPVIYHQLNKVGKKEISNYYLKNKNFRSQVMTSNYFRKSHMENSKDNWNINLCS